LFYCFSAEWIRRFFFNVCIDVHSILRTLLALGGWQAVGANRRRRPNCSSPEHLILYGRILYVSHRQCNSYRTDSHENILLVLRLGHQTLYLYRMDLTNSLHIKESVLKFRGSHKDGCSNKCRFASYAVSRCSKS
jgi:hypothetical protein